MKILWVNSGRSAVMAVCVAMVALCGLWSPAVGLSEDKPQIIQTALTHPDADVQAPPLAVVPDAAPGPEFRRALPPLSLSEAIFQMEETGLYLAESGSEVSESSIAAIRQRLDGVMRYIRRVDDANPTLPYYQWHLVGKSKVEPERTEKDEMVPLNPMERVSAIGVRVTRGDVWIDQIRIYDVDGSVTEFNLKKMIPGDSPRREVCLLDTEATLKKVEIIYRQVSRKGKKDPRVRVEAGISTFPEYGRESVHLLMLASEEIRVADARDADEHLRAAVKSLIAYQRTRKLR